MCSQIFFIGELWYSQTMKSNTVSLIENITRSTSDILDTRSKCRKCTFQNQGPHISLCLAALSCSYSAENKLLSKVVIVIAAFYHYLTQV